MAMIGIDPVGQHLRLLRKVASDLILQNTLPAALSHVDDAENRDSDDHEKRSEKYREHAQASVWPRLRAEVLARGTGGQRFSGHWSSGPEQAMLSARHRGL